MRVMVISYQSKLNPFLETVALTVHHRPDNTQVRFVRCASPTGLGYALDSVADRGGIRELELLGHGGPGLLRMGDVPLVDGELLAPGFADQVRPFLAPSGAVVRLLACRMATGDRGWRALNRVCAELACPVGAPRAYLTGWRDFDAGGVKERFVKESFAWAYPGDPLPGPVSSGSAAA